MIDIVAKLKEPKHMAWLNRLLVVVLGATIIAMGVTGLYGNIYYGSDMDYDDVASAAFFILCGAILLLSTKRPAWFCIFIIGLLFGLSSLISSMPSFTGGSDALTTVVALMNVIMILSAIHSYLGDRHSVTRMLVITVILLSLELSLYALLVALGISFKEDFWLLISPTLELWFLVLFIVFLLRPGVREETMGRKMKRGAVVVESMLSSGPEAFIYRDEAKALVSEDRSGWSVLEGAGPIRASYQATVYDGPRMFLFTAKEWKDGTVSVDIDQKLKTPAYGQSFPLRGHAVYRDGASEYLRLYGDEGFFISLLMADVPKEKHRHSIFDLFNRPDVDEVGDIISDAEDVLFDQKFIR